MLGILLDEKPDLFRLIFVVKSSLLWTCDKSLLEALPTSTFSMTIEEDCNDLILLMLLIDFIIDQMWPSNNGCGEFPNYKAQFLHSILAGGMIIGKAVQVDVKRGDIAFLWKQLLCFKGLSPHWQKACMFSVSYFGLRQILFSHEKRELSRRKIKKENACTFELLGYVRKSGVTTCSHDIRKNRELENS